MKLSIIHKLIVERNYSHIKIKAEKCVREIEKYKNRVLHQDLTNPELEGQLNDICFDFDVEFDYNNEGTAESGNYAEVGINGARCYTNGRITIFYADDFYQSFEDDYLFKQFLNMLKAVIVHEVTHEDQISKMKVEPKGTNKMSSNAAYYSNIYEMMAHANEAMQQYIDLGYSKGDIEQLLRTPSSEDGAAPQESDAFWTYYNFFNTTNPKDKKIWEKFTKYCFQYLEEL